MQCISVLCGSGLLVVVVLPAPALETERPLVEVPATFHVTCAQVWEVAAISQFFSQEITLES